LLEVNNPAPRDKPLLAHMSCNNGFFGSSDYKSAKEANGINWKKGQNPLLIL